MRLLTTAISSHILIGIYISHIKEELKKLNEKYGNNRMSAVVDFFLTSISIKQIFTLKTWSRIWSTYSMYDPSYANRESFGFFVDVGNGWTTLLPSLLYLIGMTFHNNYYYNMMFIMLSSSSSSSAKILGIIGIIKFYQEFYGTCIYFLSFFFNKRHHGKSLFEVILFVGLSNGLWFFFPILGMYASLQLILTNSYEVFM